MTTDVSTHKVTFNVKDAAAFDFEKVKDALKEQNFDDVELVSAPKSAAKSN